ESSSSPGTERKHPTASFSAAPLPFPLVRPCSLDPCPRHSIEKTPPLRQEGAQTTHRHLSAISACDFFGRVAVFSCLYGKVGSPARLLFFRKKFAFLSGRAFRNGRKMAHLVKVLSRTFYSLSCDSTS